MVTFGIEEEFLVVDPVTGLPAARAAELFPGLAALPGPKFTTSAEFLACQLETSTAVCSTLDDAAASLLASRSGIAAAASAAGLGISPAGAAPRIPEAPAELSGGGRYLLMGEVTGAVAGEHYLNGTHVHVAYPDRETGVAVLNHIRPWLAVLAALASNSPFWRGRDTGFSSWRLIHYRRWSVQGCPPLFADAADYDKRLAQLLETDVVLDSGHIGWAARLSQHYPTVEVRVGDAQLEARDSVLLAALVRALVTTAFEGADSPVHEPEMLDAGLWQAARYGLGGRLMGVHGEFSAAAEQVAALLAYVRPALEAAGDLPYVTAGLQRVLATGTGAQKQRAAAGSGGWEGLSALFSRSLTAG